MRELSKNFNKALGSMMLVFLSTISYAQIDVDIDLGKQEWYEDPKVWIGVAVFLLILAIIVRVGKK